MSPQTLPPTTEIFPWRPFVQRHPSLLNDHRMSWALRKRTENGLSDCGAVFDSPCGEILVHEPKFLAWFLGLSGRAKPRSGRRGRCGPRKARKAKAAT
jgi:hypothetical protein